MPHIDRSNRMFLVRLVATAAMLAALAATAKANSAREPDVLFFPTPQAAVDKMLEMAQLKDGDFLIDLGSGDGRIPITASKRYGIRALGVDIDQALVAEANESAKKAGVADKVVFRQQDLFETDLSEATVITMFLLTSINMQLRPELLKLKPGTRILSYAFGMGEWKPSETEVVDGRFVHLWVVPEETPGLESHEQPGAAPD